jgi:MFS family permease
MQTGTSFTTYGWLLCLWTLIIPFQYGYHVSILNQIQSVLTCQVIEPKLDHDLSSLPTCIPMDDVTFSVVTAIYTIGGLLGSLIANVVMDRYGRKGAARGNALFVALGTGLMGFSSNVSMLAAGR